MAEKKSVFLSNETAQWIRSTTGESPKWSESINATFAQFRALLKASIPILTKKEWGILVDVFEDIDQPAYYGHQLGISKVIAAKMLSHAGAISIDSLPDDDFKALLIKAHKLTELEQLAVLYCIQMLPKSHYTAFNNAALLEIKNQF